MTLEAFNAIAQNMRQQFPGMSEAFILQQTTEIYLVWLKIAAKRVPTGTHIRVESDRVRDGFKPRPRSKGKLFKRNDQA